MKSTAEIKVPCPDEVKFAVVAKLVRRFRMQHDVVDIDGARVRLQGGSWFLVRASNTTPNLTVRLEAPTLPELTGARDLLYEALSEYPDVDARVLLDEVPE